jgi:hypothetical protein
MNKAHLDQALLAAHAARDIAALVPLYTSAGDEFEAQGDIDAACFYLTQAFVFALEAGSPQAVPLSHRLATHGRAEPLAP